MKKLSEAQLATLRRHMVEVIEIEFDLASTPSFPLTLSSPLREALLDVPRHRFVPPPLIHLAYENRPLPIGFDKTVSQPFMSALMIALLELKPGARVLEVGTGLGYQTALLARLAAEVFSVDVVEEFATAAAGTLAQLDCDNVAIKMGDGSRGWPDAGPFDAILVSAAVEDIPQPLAQQLRHGGRLVVPIGRTGSQRLAQGVREGHQLTVREILPVAFTELETVF
jgi:protein-L-isoaspartate(D-aspartate) O-methyltransferase